MTKKVKGRHNQFDTATVLLFYAWLSAAGALVENPCRGYGTNSTPNHLLIVGGPSPTLTNPSRAGRNRCGTCRPCPATAPTAA